MAFHRAAVAALSIVGVFMSTSSVINPPHRTELLALGEQPGTNKQVQSAAEPTVGIVPAAVPAPNIPMGHPRRIPAEHRLDRPPRTWVTALQDRFCPFPPIPCGILCPPPVDDQR
ncbi:hypothetical protein ACQP1O_19940 [Nocardia sp. CA-151230]|uniref:hypothetical protein n=1 Tax=Nocardia sp. CA-151230 TaxID=3239982 RepID=UPI003D8D591A